MLQYLTLWKFTQNLLKFTQNLLKIYSNLLKSRQSGPSPTTRALRRNGITPGMRMDCRAGLVGAWASGISLYRPGDGNFT